jgi:hypothetical protein
VLYRRLNYDLITIVDSLAVLTDNDLYFPVPLTNAIVDKMLSDKIIHHHGCKTGTQILFIFSVVSSSLI